MPPLIGNLIVLLAVIGAVGLALRSIWRSRKAGRCVGCSSGCSGCSGHCSHTEAPEGREPR